MLNYYRVIALMCLLTSVNAYSQNYLVSVHGIVCELCSFGVAKNIRKLPFIDSTQLDEGVRVDINNQQVTVAIKAETSISKSALFKAIEDGGYKPVSLWLITANGEKQEIIE